MQPSGAVVGLYQNSVIMKNTLLLFAICLTTLASFGQDRRDGLVQID